MNPRIIDIEVKKLIGNNVKMSLISNKTGELWGGFSPRIREIKNRISADKISMQVYPHSYHKDFNPDTIFEKWAVVEVDDFEDIPEGMSEFLFQGGLYAVFDYKGSSLDTSIYQYIFYDWLPKSDYIVDDRPHYEILGPNYKNAHPESEEEIWIPIRKK